MIKKMFLAAVALLSPLVILAQEIDRPVESWNSVEYSFKTHGIKLETVGELRFRGTDIFDKRISLTAAKEFKDAVGVYSTIMGRANDWGTLAGKTKVDFDNRFVVGVYVKITEDVKIKMYHENHFNRHERPVGNYIYNTRLRQQVTYYKPEGLSFYFYEDVAFVPNGGLYRSRTRIGAKEVILHSIIAYQYQTVRLTPFNIGPGVWLGQHAIVTMWSF